MRAKLFVLMMGLVMFGWSTTAMAGAPTDFVKKKTEVVSKIMSKPDSRKRAKQLDAELKKVVDFRELANRSLGEHWTKATDAQKKQFLDLLQEMLEANYSKKLSGKKLNKDFKVAYDAEKTRGKQAIVKTRILADGESKPVMYRLIQREKTWIAYDIVIDDISLEETYRESYTKIIKKYGFDGLLNRMKKKAAQLRKG